MINFKLKPSKNRKMECLTEEDKERILNFSNEQETFLHYILSSKDITLEIVKGTLLFLQNHEHVLCKTNMHGRTFVHELLKNTEDLEIVHYVFSS